MTDMKDANPLEELYTDALSQIEPAALATILKPYVRINRENKNIIFTHDGMALTANNKIILFLLARKVMFINKEITSEAIAPKDIKSGLNLPAGTIDAALKQLSEKGPLRGEKRKYLIPDFNFNQVQGIFSKLGKGK
jgi:hypothetical protein